MRKPLSDVCEELQTQNELIIFVFCEMDRFASDTGISFFVTSRDPVEDPAISRRWGELAASSDLSPNVSDLAADTDHHFKKYLKIASQIAWTPMRDECSV